MNDRDTPSQNTKRKRHVSVAAFAPALQHLAAAVLDLGLQLGAHRFLLMRPRPLALNLAPIPQRQHRPFVGDSYLGRIASDWGSYASFELSRRPRLKTSQPIDTVLGRCLARHFGRGRIQGLRFQLRSIFPFHILDGVVHSTALEAQYYADEVTVSQKGQVLGTNL